MDLEKQLKGLGKRLIWVDDHKRQNELVEKDTSYVVYVEYPRSIRAYRNVHYPKAFARKILSEANRKTFKSDIVSILSGNNNEINVLLWEWGDEEVSWRNYTR